MEYFWAPAHLGENMRHDHRLSRRLFLAEFGRRTFAVAVLGGVVGACGSSSDADRAESDRAEPDRAESDRAESDRAESSTTAAGESRAAAPAGEALRWERADFGFVSAYVLARGNEVAIVDTGTAGNTVQIEQALSALSFGWDDVDHVIVTHAHGDHIGGLEAVLTAAPTAVGYAGAGDVEGISAPRELVSVTGGDEVFGLEIVGTPGHTPGHICAFDPGTGLLLAGDAMVTNSGSLAGPVPEFSDDLALAQASVKAMADTPVETIVVGHGDPIIDDAGTQLRRLAAEL